MDILKNRDINFELGKRAESHLAFSRDVQKNKNQVNNFSFKYIFFFGLVLLYLIIYKVMYIGT